MFERHSDIRAGSCIVNGQLVFFACDLAQAAFDPLYGNIALFCCDSELGCNVHVLRQPIPTCARV